VESLVELARFAKADPYGEPRRKVPGERTAYAAGGGVLGAAGYLARQGQKAKKRKHPGSKFVFRQAAKTGAVGAGIVGAGLGIRHVNKPKEPEVSYAPGG